MHVFEEYYNFLSKIKFIFNEKFFQNAQKNGHTLVELGSTSTGFACLQVIYKLIQQNGTTLVS